MNIGLNTSYVFGVRRSLKELKRAAIMTSLQDQLCKAGFPSSVLRARLVASMLQKSDWYDITVRGFRVIQCV